MFVYFGHTYTSGSNMFLIFRQGVGLIIGGLTAHWKFSNAERINKEKSEKGTTDRNFRVNISVKFRIQGYCIHVTLTQASHWCTKS